MTKASPSNKLTKTFSDKVASLQTKNGPAKPKTLSYKAKTRGVQVSQSPEVSLKASRTKMILSKPKLLNNKLRESSDMGFSFPGLEGLSDPFLVPPQSQYQPLPYSPLKKVQSDRNQ